MQRPHTRYLFEHVCFLGLCDRLKRVQRLRSIKIIEASLSLPRIALISGAS